MFLLSIYALIAGFVTILSPCILPILPIILSSSADTSGKRRPIGVVVGFIASFTFFTLFLSAIVRASGIPADSFRLLSIGILIIFGASLFVPSLQKTMERLMTTLASAVPQGRKVRQGFFGGVLIGLSIGLLWTPCVGPILASVITLALSGSVSTDAFILTLAYSIGTAIPMLAIMYAGSTALSKVPWLLANTARIQKAFGIMMVLTAIGIYFNVDRTFQTYILTKFPQYGVGLTRFEDTEAIHEELQKVRGKDPDESMIGKPMSDVGLQKGPVAPEIIPGGEWFNSEPLTLESLRGKVVLLDFWTYSCINCQRTFPYLRNWWERYESEGLVIIGVHAPEFEFEKDPDNVAQAISDFDLTYPVVQDNAFVTWRAYNNRYWPAKYLIDKDGTIRYTHFGEGKYDETERQIQKLLNEAGAITTPDTINNPEYETYGQTPELYLGYGRLARFASPEKVRPDTLSSYSIPSILPENEVAYDGEWNVMKEHANPRAGSKLEVNFGGKEVYLVMKSRPDHQASVKVFVDGTVQYLGDDVNEEGIVTIDSDTLYKLVKLPQPGRHILRLQFLDDYAEIFAFTFG